MPSIPSYAQCYYQAYQVLAGSKIIGMAVSQIPYSEVRLFALDYGFDPLELFEVISEVELLLAKDAQDGRNSA